jgi:HEPN domain-containing protein
MSINRLPAIEWLKVAYSDLVLIEEIINNDYLTHMVAFHSQQAVEKSLKALIEYYKIDFVKTHNLEKLYKKLEGIIELDYEMLELLNELYIDSRYPGDFGLLPDSKPTINEAREFYDFAKKTFDRVCEILNVNKKEII